MIGFANAKINIGLFVTGRREDGFHNLESVFYPIPFQDVLEIIPNHSGRNTFIQSGISIPGDENDNIVLKAARLFQREFGLPFFDICLQKNIPTGAGLGGGSSDGALMLKMMDEKFSLQLSTATLENYAMMLGSDCGFFIRNKPARISGRGEIISPIELDLSQHYITIIHPGVHISTKDAFSKVKPSKASFDLDQIASLKYSNWRDNLKNDFEESVFSLHPEIEQIKDDLYRQGAWFASMSGSGSSVYGLFDFNPQDITSKENYIVKTLKLK